MSSHPLKKKQEKLASLILRGRASSQFKEKFYQRVQQQVLRRCDLVTPHACLYWTFFTLKELWQLGVRGSIQSGSAYWPRVNRATYDAHPEEQSTHFGYEWSPRSVASHVSVALGNLPEVHIWVGLVESQEILDLSTGYWPQACQKLIGKDWPGPRPPKFYWGRACEVPEMVVYRPNEPATVYAGKVLQTLIRERRF